MPTLCLLSPSKPRREALLEQLVRLPGLAMAEQPAQADALLLDIGAAPPEGLSLPVLRLDELKLPLRWAELARRIGMLLDRARIEAPFPVGPYQCLPLERLLRAAAQKEPTRLTDKEVELLQALYEAGAEGISRADLLEQVWGYKEELETHTLETHIYRLRQKLESDPAQPQWLLTTETGYRLQENG